MEPKWNYTSRGVQYGDIFENYKLGKGNNSNYLQTERSSRWSGWRDSNSRHPAPKAGALPDCATPRKVSDSIPTARMRPGWILIFSAEMYKTDFGMGGAERGKESFR